MRMSMSELENPGVLDREVLSESPSTLLNVVFTSSGRYVADLSRGHIAVSADNAESLGLQIERGCRSSTTI